MSFKDDVLSLQSRAQTLAEDIEKALVKEYGEVPSNEKRAKMPERRRKEFDKLIEASQKMQNTVTYLGRMIEE